MIPAALAWVGKLIIDSVVAAARAGGLRARRGRCGWWRWSWG